MFCERFVPDNLDDFFIHERACSQIKHILDNSTYIPHIILHGPEGCGKQSIAWAIMNELYSKFKLMRDPLMVVGEKILDGRNKKRVVKRIYNKNIVIWSPVDDHAYEDDSIQMASISNLLDKSDLVRRSTTDQGDNNNHLTCFMVGLDRISKGNQSVLRKYMECKSDNVRFLITCRSLDCIDPAIISRSVCIRLEYPNEQQLNQLGSSIMNQLLQQPTRPKLGQQQKMQLTRREKKWVNQIKSKIHHIVTQFLNTQTIHSPFHFLVYLENYEYKSKHWSQYIVNELFNVIAGWTEMNNRQNETNSFEQSYTSMRGVILMIMRRGVSLKTILLEVLEKIWDSNTINGWAMKKSIAKITLQSLEHYTVDEDAIFFLEKWTISILSQNNNN